MDKSVTYFILNSEVLWLHNLLLQEAFFGKDLLDKSKQSRQETTRLLEDERDRKQLSANQMKPLSNASLNASAALLPSKAAAARTFLTANGAQTHTHTRPVSAFLFMFLSFFFFIWYSYPVWFIHFVHLKSTWNLNRPCLLTLHTFLVLLWRAGASRVTQKCPLMERKMGCECNFKLSLNLTAI